MNSGPARDVSQSANSDSACRGGFNIAANVCASTDGDSAGTNFAPFVGGSDIARNYCVSSYCDNTRQTRENRTCDRNSIADVDSTRFGGEFADYGAVSTDVDDACFGGGQVTFNLTVSTDGDGASYDVVANNFSFKNCVSA